MILITIINKDLHTLNPIIFEFKENITKHIIIYDIDENDKKVAKGLKKSITKLNKKYNLSQTIELLEIDEDSKSDMIMIQNSLKDLALDTLYLNATNSDISLVVVLSGFILNSGGKVIAYDKQDNTYNLIETKGFLNYDIKNSMKIEDFIILMNYELKNEQSKIDIISKKESLYFLFQNFQDMFKIRDLIYQNRLKELREKYISFMPHIKKLDILNRETSYFGILFEELIYLKLLTFSFDDIKLGATIDFGKEYQNEFDFIAIHNNHIYTIECKIGGNMNVKPNDVIYKCDALLDAFGGDSKSLILNIQKENSPLNFKDTNIKRAIGNNIEVYNEYVLNTKQFQRAIATFFNIKQRVFLLGGNDLEMSEIKNILNLHGQRVKDRNLVWGAKLSDYADMLKKDSILIGIELSRDITPPKNYIEIDHHNENQAKPSSLEQVASMLHVELSRYQRLVAINDVGHIKAMIEFGASSKEIEQIRKKDRELQGVTIEDEKEAKISISNQQEEDDILIIKSSIEKFSPIVDRLYDKNLLIYTKTKLNYYGRDIQKLVKKYQFLIDENKAYYGGDFGFFGIADGVFGKKKIKLIRDEILDLLKSKKK